MKSGDLIVGIETGIPRLVAGIFISPPRIHVSRLDKSSLNPLNLRPCVSRDNPTYKRLLTKIVTILSDWHDSVFTIVPTLT